MDDLPPPLILDILSRLGDSADLASCRVASKTFNSLSRDIRSINLHCSFDRYAKSRCPLTRSSITPFKTILKNLVSELRIVESVTIGIDKPLRTVSYDDVEDEDDDLYLTEVNFVGEWLPKVSDGLTSFSISDFWVQSCWRRSEVLSLISSYCESPSFDIYLLYTSICCSWLIVMLFSCEMKSLVSNICFSGFWLTLAQHRPFVINLVWTVENKYSIGLHF